METANFDPQDKTHITQPFEAAKKQAADNKKKRNRLSPEVKKLVEAYLNKNGVKGTIAAMKVLQRESIRHLTETLNSGDDHMAMQAAKMLFYMGCSMHQLEVHQNMKSYEAGIDLSEPIDLSKPVKESETPPTPTHFDPQDFTQGDFAPVD